MEWVTSFLFCVWEGFIDEHFRRVLLSPVERANLDRSVMYGISKTIRPKRSRRNSSRNVLFLREMTRCPVLLNDIRLRFWLVGTKCSKREHLEQYDDITAFVQRQTHTERPQLFRDTHKHNNLLTIMLTIRKEKRIFRSVNWNFSLL